MPTTRRRLARPTAMTASAILAAGLAACSSVAAPGSPVNPPARSGAPGTTPPSASTPAPATSAPASSPSGSLRGTAAGQLESFLAKAAAWDTQLKRAAVLINQGISATTIRVTPGTWNAVHAMYRSWPVDQAGIPAGLPPELLRSVLLVYSDLVSRTAAMDRIGRIPDDAHLPLLWRVSSYEGRDFLQALGHGTPAAVRFGADLTALRDLAAATPRLTLAAPDSRAAAEVALRMAQINLANRGCASSGGQVFTTLSRIVWQPTDAGSGHPADGTVGGISFTAKYLQRTGWKVQLFAC